MIKTIIIDDHPLVRDGMSVMLDSEKDFEVLGVAEDGNAAISLCKRVGNPDLAICDVRMKGMDGFQTLVALRNYSPKIKVLLLAGMPLSSELENAKALGASGYMSKSAPSSQIVQAARNAVSGKGFQQEKSGFVEANAILTHREMEVLNGLKDGLTRDQIADRLNISVETVKCHCKSMMVKLGAPSSAGAVGRAYDLGILQP